MKSTLNCIILFVRDVEMLKHFYIDNFNLELAEEMKQEWVLLKAGLCELGLHKIRDEYLNEGAPERVENNTKIVFEIDEDIFVVHKKLEANSIALKEIKTWENYPYWVFDGEDPEGNVFQIRMSKEKVTL